MKKILSILIAFLFLPFFFSTVLATNDPLSVSNNKYGIHIMDENDLEDASNLVNSSGGDWGYVTFVITENERNHARWQRVFDRMRKLHLIPIVRIATRSENGVWVKPSSEEIDNWVTFFNSLNWVIQNRYVIIANEPNHAKEWGNTINPGEYATYLKEFSQKLRDSSDNYFILPAGFDASANNSGSTMDEKKYLSEMVKKEPNVFNYIQGWTSHSYPNPAFSGKATDTGKGTITSYDWELSYLKSLGVKSDFPIFITETGWSNSNLSEEEIGKRFEYAFNNAWIDTRIVAVTPFILNYITPPFDEFSWKKSDSSFRSYYDSIKNTQKVKGEPIQEVKGKILGVFLNPFTIAGSSFKGVVLAQNLGQSIWVTPEVSVQDESGNFELTTEAFSEVEPQRIQLIYVNSTTPNLVGKYESSFVLRYKDKNITDPKPVEILILEPSELKNPSFFGRILGFIKGLI